MTYKIAIGSSDGVNVDLKFGEAEEFLIYQVEGTNYQLSEKRIMKLEKLKEVESVMPEKCSSKTCGTSSCLGTGHGCSGSSDIADKISVILDCRCVVCKKIGFQAQKQFEKKAISIFDVECEVKEALNKIVLYYDKIDAKKH